MELVLEWRLLLYYDGIMVHNKITVIPPVTLQLILDVAVFLAFFVTPLQVVDDKWAPWDDNYNSFSDCHY